LVEASRQRCRIIHAPDGHSELVKKLLKGSLPVLLQQLPNAIEFSFAADERRCSTGRPGFSPRGVFEIGARAG
jgi:hypothetical protein